jgi:glycine/D-amino acid oxidase-like deaminating enzyme
VEPRAAVHALREHLAAKDAYRFLPGRTAVDVDTGSVVDDRGETHRADLVVLCTGDATGPLLRDHFAQAGLRRCRLLLLQTAPFDDHLETSIADGDSLRYYPAFRLPSLGRLPAQAPWAAAWRAQLLLVQRASGQLTVGDTHEYDEPFDFAVEEEPLQQLLTKAATLLGRSLPPVVRRWVGIYAQASDERLLHQEEVLPGVVVTTGLGGRGMTLSPAIAERTLTAAGL